MKCQWLRALAFAAAAFAAVQSSAYAQSAWINGSAGNFDVANNQSEDAHGFEVEFENVHPEDIASTFDTQRYGPPRIAATPTGVIVRWESGYDGARFVATTVPHDPAAALAGSCYQWAGDSYAPSGCEHFGVTLMVNASRTTYRWLVADPFTPGALIAGRVPIPVATPAYSVAAPAASGGAPVLNADVDAPPGDGYPTRYGDAFWMKVFRTQLNRSVRLDELTNDNPNVVPDDSSHAEVLWTLIQADPLIQFSTGKKSRTRTRNGAPLAGETGAVVRRYELYEYTGLYDPFFHQAVCADPDCAAPAPGESGALLSAQMTAADVVVPSVTVTKVGGGKVESKDKLVSCGLTCVASYGSGEAVTLIASPTSGYVFSGWSGACSGTSSTCTIDITAHVNVAATFVAKTTATRTAPAPTTSPTPTTPASTTTASPTSTGTTTTPPSTGTTNTPAPATTTIAPTTITTAGSSSRLSAPLVNVSIGFSNKGSVVTLAGPINCPGACSAKFVPGTTVTLTAIPTVAPFVSWNGACTGTESTCTFTVTRDSQVQATFAK